MLQICDTMMISGMGENAISGVSVANKFFFVYQLALFGLTNGIGLFISQYFGSNDRPGYNKFFRFGLKASLVVALLCTVFLLIYPQWTLTIFVENKEVIKYGLEYVNIVRFSYIPFAISMMCAVAFRVKGKTILPMKSGTIAFVVNIVFNFLLIFGKFGFPALGVKGAAIATLLSRVIEMIILLAMCMARGSDLSFKEKYGKLNRNEVKEAIKKTLPLLGNEIVWSLSLSFIFMNYCFVDEFYIPALTVVDNITSMLYVVFAGCATATGVIIGKSLGANNFDQARKDAKRLLVIGFMINLVGSIIILLFARSVPTWFSLQGEIAKATIILLVIKCSISWTQGYCETVYYILRAGGDTKGVFIIDGAFTCLGPLLISTLCARVFDVDLFMMFTFVEGVAIVKVALSTYYYKKDKWLKNLTQISTNSGKE
ncbi:MAG: MATE family efflux transporter [Erysipelotrichia bacterium]|nr:MATE family efflux transporter [Erysipelotrichia bacterium]NCC54938.1 MATE family efflux transporter [Erysipelotrichia bacterium]